MKSFFLFCFLILLTSQRLVVAQEVEKPTDYTGWQKFESHKFGYGFKIPPTWVVNFKNDSGDYIFHSTKNPKDANNLSIEINCKDLPKEHTLDKFFDDSKLVAKSKLKNFTAIDERPDIINEVDTKWITFLYTEGEVKKQAALYSFVYNRRGYNITFSANLAIYNNQTEYLTTIFKSLDIASFQPCATITINPPEKWFPSKKADYLFVFSAKNTGDKSVSDGVMKIKQNKLSKNLKTKDFLIEVQAEILKERPNVGFSGTSFTQPINGQVFSWFDVIEKDSQFVERYYISTYQRCGIIIYHISDKAKFETNVKMQIAEALQTFKLGK